MSVLRGQIISFSMRDSHIRYVIYVVAVCIKCNPGHTSQFAGSVRPNLQICYKTLKQTKIGIAYTRSTHTAAEVKLFVNSRLALFLSVCKSVYFFVYVYAKNLWLGNVSASILCIKNLSVRTLDAGYILYCLGMEKDISHSIFKHIMITNYKYTFSS